MAYMSDLHPNILQYTSSGAAPVSGSRRPEPKEAKTLWIHETAFPHGSTTVRYTVSPPSSRSGTSADRDLPAREVLQLVEKRTRR